MIEPGQKLIRYISGMVPRIVNVVHVEGRQAVTSDYQTVDAKTLQPADEGSSDHYDLFTPNTLAMAQQCQLGIDFCATFGALKCAGFSNGRLVQAQA